MSDIVALLLPFFGLIFIGYAAARIKHQPAEALGWMNTFIIYATLPALFFKLVSRTPIEQLARMDFVAAAVGAAYIVFILVFLVGKFVRRNSSGESTIQAFAASYGNVGYMGPGLALLAFGDEAAVPLALLVSMENAVHFIVAPAMMSVSGSDRRPLPVLILQVVRKVITHPFILSVIAGFIAAALAWQPPLAAQRLIDYLAQAAAPCALFSMGVTLALRPVKRVPAEIYYIVPAKLVLHPIIACLVLTTVGGFDAVWVQTAILLAALPTATNVFVIGQQYNTWQERASATILISTVLSVLTVSATLYLVNSGYLASGLLP